MDSPNPVAPESGNAEKARAWIPVAMTVALAAIGLALLPVIASFDRITGSPFGLPWWIVVLGPAGAEIARVSIGARNENSSITIIEIVIVLTFWFASPLGAIVGLTCGAAIGSTRLSGLKAAFNVATQLATVSVCYLAFRLLLGDSEPVFLRGLLATLLTAGALLSATQRLAVNLVVKLFRGGVSLFDEFWLRMLIDGISTLIGLLAALVLWERPSAAWLLGLAVVAFGIAVRQYAVLDRRSTRVHYLYDFIRAVNSLSGEELQAGVLDSAKKGLRSTKASIVDAAGLPFRPGIGATAITRATFSERKWLEERGYSEAAAAVIDTGSSAPRALVVADRLAKSTSFDEDDLLLLEAMAVHAGVEFERAGLLEQLVYEASHDPLTGLPNRRAFLDLVAKSLATDEGRVHVMIIDLDGFKGVNDTLGHATGDELLRATARHLGAAVHGGGVTGRLGGDEFGICLRDMTDERAGAVAERLIEAIETVAGGGSTPGEISASIGVAAGDRQSSVRQLLVLADAAMYDAKRAGRGRVAWSAAPNQSPMTPRLPARTQRWAPDA